MTEDCDCEDVAVFAVIAVVVHLTTRTIVR